MVVSQNSYGELQICAVCSDPLEKARAYPRKKAICQKCQRRKAHLYRIEFRRLHPEKAQQYKETSRKNELLKLKKKKNV